MKPSKDWGTPAHRGLVIAFSLLYVLVFCYVLLFFCYLLVVFYGCVLLAFCYVVIVWKSGFELWWSYAGGCVMFAFCQDTRRSWCSMRICGRCVPLVVLLVDGVFLRFLGLYHLSGWWWVLEYNWLPDLWALDGCFGAEGWLVPSWCPRDDLYNIFRLSVVI